MTPAACESALTSPASTDEEVCCRYLSKEDKSSGESRPRAMSKRDLFRLLGWLAAGLTYLLAAGGRGPAECFGLLSLPRWVDADCQPYLVGRLFIIGVGAVPTILLFYFAGKAEGPQGSPPKARRLNQIGRLAPNSRLLPDSGRKARASTEVDVTPDSGEVFRCSDCRFSGDFASAQRHYLSLKGEHFVTRSMGADN